MKELLIYLWKPLRWLLLLIILLFIISLGFSLMNCASTILFIVGLLIIPMSILITFFIIKTTIKNEKN